MTRVLGLMTKRINEIGRRRNRKILLKLSRMTVVKKMNHQLVRMKMMIGVQTLRFPRKREFSSQRTRL